jgi:hypothetical protein
MRALFPPIEHLEPWVDKYTGKTMIATPGTLGEKQGKQHSAPSTRRSLFFEGSSEKPQRPDSEEKLAEVIRPPMRPSPEFVRGASKFFGGNHLAEEGSKLPTIERPLPAAPMRNAPLREERINSGTEIKNTGEGLKQSAAFGIGGKIKARDAQLHSEKVERQISSSTPAQFELTKSEKTFHDTIQVRSVQSYTPVQVHATLKLKEASKAHEIVLELLSNVRGQAVDTVAVSELNDIAKKLTLPTSQKTSKTLDLPKQALEDATTLEFQVDKSLEQKKTAPQNQNALLAPSKGTQDLRVQKETLVDYSKDRLSTDVIIAAQRSMGDLKDDPEEQLRIGTWAVHVLSGRMDSVPSEILRGMKKDALLALGRLSMQLLASSAKSAQTEFQSIQSKVKLVSERGGGRQASLLNAASSTPEARAQEIEAAQQVRENLGDLQKGAIKGANEFFRMESIQGDLQALQNNISLDFTADMLVEGFIDALRNDDLDAQREIRTDILSQFKAAQTMAGSKKEELGSQQRTTKISFSSGAGYAGTPPSTKRSGGMTQPRESSEVHVELKGPRHESTENIVKEFMLEQTTLKVEEGGAWSNAPGSKYIE